MSETVRKSPGGGGQIIINAAAAAEIVKVLARHNPGASKAALTTTKAVILALSGVASQLSVRKQHTLVAHERELTKVVEAAVADLAARAPVELAPVHVTKPVEVSKGEGLGTLGDVEEGRRSLDATAISMRLEDWAGPVGGPRDIETKFGTKRSTLHDWQKRGAVIGLLKGERKHVFPLAQFVDGRPVEGMTAVTRIIKNPRVAWQWLIQRKPSIGGSPLDRLKKGRLDEVVAAAQRDFG
ncbi:hypothetical protein [uncultured Rhodoblastus sp.]|uniref:antitoxin Xre/MbcA/ParS-like domain-containing protein n=1 Tax=uncultured Rhodoblastus sp. TaxID=543037 RepID=UPI0025F1D026|nr:hypothetical protein [uncultured Rhodoblastus sp.]